jgi:hypothetical protein
MTTWTDTDLAHFGDAQEVRIAGMRRTARCVRRSSCGWCAMAKSSTPDR